MWGAKAKNKAVDLWHTKAMLVDPRKTKITIIWSTASETCETEKTSEIQAINCKTDYPKNNSVPNVNQAKGLEVVNHNLETAEQNFQPMKLLMDKTPDYDETTEKLEIAKLNIETRKPEEIEAIKATFPKKIAENTFEKLENMESYYEIPKLEDSEILSTDETPDGLENAKPSLQNIAADLVETQNIFQYQEDAGIVKQNLETTECKPPETLNTIFSCENLMVEQINEIEAATAFEEYNNFELNPIEKVPENAMFLRILEKTRSKWDNDKQFAKIVQKMEKGKKLKGKEFEKVYMHIRNYNQCT